MIKKIFLITVILPIITVFLSVFFSSQTYANEHNPLFIYENEIIKQVGDKKRETTNSFDEITQYRVDTTEKNNISNYYAQQIFNKLKRDYHYSILEKILTYEYSAPKVNNFFDYISQIVEKRQKGNIFDHIESTILSFERERNIKEDSTLLADSYLETFFERTVIEQDLRYENFIASIPISSTEKETISYKEITEPQIVASEDKEIVQKQESTDSKPNSGSSKDVTLSLTILPVRFVYINKDNQIEKIWNNVEKDDDKYGLKFYSSDSNTEIDSNSNLMAQYFELVKKINIFGEGIIYDRNIGIVRKDYAINNIEIEFNKTSSGTKEIYTLI